MNRLIAFFGLVIASAVPNTGQADLIINISSPAAVTAGTTATVTFSAFSNTAQNFDGYQFAIDIGGGAVGGAGGGLPSGVSSPTLTQGTAFGGATALTLNGAGGSNFDLYVTDDSGGSSVSAGTAPSLFSLSFDTTGYAPGSFVPVSIVAVPTAPFSSTAFNGGGSVAFTSNVGGVSVAVPEPSSAAMVGLFGIGLAGYRRRRVAC